MQACLQAAATGRLQRLPDDGRRQPRRHAVLDLQVGTRTAWTPVKDLTISAEFLYSRLDQNLNGTWTSGTTIPGAPAGRVFTLGDQNVYNGAVQILPLLLIVIV